MSGTVRIVIAAEAEGDLQAIYDQRLAQRGAQGSDGADALLDKLFATISSLAEFPLRGPVPPELESLGIADWRQISDPPYRIIYALGGDTLTVAVVADARRDFADLLERRLLQRPPRS
jgi:toxin ParE1/3/4